MQTADHVVTSDLDYISDQAGAEFARMSGRRLTIAGGAGFLGYYLVQSALHWNRRNPGSAPIDLVVLDSFVRGVPAWLTALESDPNLTLVRHDVTQAPPAVLGDLDYLIHAASIASPIYYRQHPIETMDANVGGLRHFLDYAMRQKQKGRPLQGILFYSSSEIYGDPTPDQIPTPETYRANVSCTGP
ncbi:NAD-dependent epimerase/dehydratase family protein, partial [Myxococcota bacterium]|nr:NAD-dependent epimerase/dehydratase family protein [Myxococcota bacterium]